MRCAFKFITMVVLAIFLSGPGLRASAETEAFEQAYLDSVEEDAQLRAADCSKLNEWVCLCVNRTLPVRVKNPSDDELEEGLAVYRKFLSRGNSSELSLEKAVLSVVRSIQTDIAASCKKPVFSKDDS